MIKKRWKCNISYDDHGEIGIYAFDSKGWYAYLEKLKPNTVSVTVEKWKPTTTHPQFKYYYGVVLELIATETGIDKDSLDEILKSKFLYEYIEINGKPIKKPISKTAVTTTEFNKYIEQVVCWAISFLNLVIPEPNEAE